jgi:enolase-phosphatase E1
VARAILTDIEGTTSSIAFVKEVLFPYARRALPGFVAAHGGEPVVRRWLGAVAEETGATGDDPMIATLQGWIDQDRKHTALKALQGMIWCDGYRQGVYTAHVYDDAPANRTYRDVGLLGGTGRSCAPGTRPATRCTSTRPARWRRNGYSLATAPPAI